MPDLRGKYGVSLTICSDQGEVDNGKGTEIVLFMVGDACKAAVMILPGVRDSFLQTAKRCWTPDVSSGPSSSLSSADSF